MIDHDADQLGNEHNLADNRSHVRQAISGNWILAAALIYMPIGLYLTFIAHPLRSLFGIDATAGALVTELLIWVAAPLIALVLLHQSQAGSGN